ncbi:MAG: DUF5309 family protein [Sphaerochaeta sp.]|jgi:hypothetical protein
MAMFGMRGTGDWVTDQRPKSWREAILYLYPNGDAPLTALMSMVSSESPSDPEFYWWTQTFPTQKATVTGVYTDTGLGTGYASGAAAGTVLYFKMSAADIAHFRVGHQVLCRDASDYTVDVNGKVVARTVNGDSSFVGVRLLEADDNSTAGDLSDCDTLLVIGNINPEGGAMPQAVAYDPAKLYNYTQIFRTPLSITRTAMKTRLRTGDAYAKAKKEALEIHSVEIEKALLWGIPTENVGDNGKPERTTGGLLHWIRTYGTVSNYPTNEAYDGKTWVLGGQDFLNAQLEIMFRYGPSERLALCGTGAILGIDKLVKAAGEYKIGPNEKVYGMNVRRWITPFGDVLLKIHPLFSHEATNRQSMVIFSPEYLKQQIIDDTDFYDDKSSGRGRIDGKEEEFLTELGLELHHPSTMGFLTGIGSDNAASE